MRQRIKRVGTLLLLGSCVVAPAPEVRGQAGYELVPTIEIPRDYRSWSLFLVCNPAWILRNGDEGIANLFWQYKAFSDAIGPENLAIWFWKEPAAEPSAELTDTSRSSEYCQRYKLLPSKSPYVLVTTRHPDDQPVGDYFSITLNGLSAHDSADALAKLTDQLLVTGLRQAELDASTRWQRLLAATTAALSAVGCYFNNVSFSFNTAVFKAEIAHSVENTGQGC